jgi:oxygen-dependent protoporphyrinogen oxidase
MAAEVAMRPRPPAADESIHSFLARHFGREVVERVGEPLLAGIHAGDPGRLSMASTFPRFVEMESRHGSLIRALWGGRPAAGSEPVFVSLKGGLQELVQAAATRLPDGAIRTGWAVDGVTSRGGRWTIEGKGGRIECGQVIVALPPSGAARVLSSLDGDLATQLGAIRSVSTAVAYLGYRREDVAHSLAGHGVVVPRTEGLRVSALSFVSTKFPGRAPEGHVLLRAFLGGARDPDALGRDDAALVSQVVSEFTSLLGLRGAPRLTRVFRWPQGTPQMEVGHAGRVAAIDERIARWPGLALTGAGLRGTGIPDTVGDAALQVAGLPLSGTVSGLASQRPEEEP